MSSGRHGALELEHMGCRPKQTDIAGKTVYLQGAKISPAQVAKFVDLWHSKD